MRKYLIVAVAALTAWPSRLSPLPRLLHGHVNVKLTPKKAGTKKKPKNSQIKLKIANATPSGR